MSNFHAIRPGFVIVNGAEMVGTIFDTFPTDYRTILDKVMLVNHTSSPWYVDLFIRKLGQTTNDLRFRVLVKKYLAPHQTYILEDELRGEAMDYPARIVGDVFDAAGTPFQTGNVSIFVTVTQKKN